MDVVLLNMRGRGSCIESTPADLLLRFAGRSVFPVVLVLQVLYSIPSPNHDGYRGIRKHRGCSVVHIGVLASWVR